MRVGMNCLSIEQLGFERNDIPLFEGVNAQWNAGDIVQLGGPNGSGKTTLLRILAGFMPATRGRVLWNNEPVTSFSCKAALLYLGHHVGVKLTLTPLENLIWYFGLHGRKAVAPHEAALSKKDMLSALNKVDLFDYADVPCYQLSAGQQRRVALARLYLSRAPLWLLDEPFTAIDKLGVQALEERLNQQVSDGGIVLLTTHQRCRAENIQLFDLARFKACVGAHYD